MTLEKFIKRHSLPFAECHHTVNSGRHFKPHMHTTFSIGAIDRGEVVYQVGKQKATLQRGGLALINPEILHACNPGKSCERSYLMLYLNKDWCCQVQQSLWQGMEFREAQHILLEDDILYDQYRVVMDAMMDTGTALLKQEQLLV